MSFSLTPAPHVPQRRHTTTTALPVRRLSRPFVSSPLAGPVVSSDGTTSAPAPTRTASAPELAPAAIARPAHPRRPRPATISGRSELARLAAEEERRAGARSRRASVYGEPVPPLPASLHPPQPEAIPPVPPLPTIVPRRRTSSARPATSPSTPPSLSRTPTSASPAADPSEHWLTSTPPPRFSRHSLALAGVVMPVRADAASHRSRRSASSASDSASVCSTGSVGSVGSASTAATSPCESLKEAEGTEKGKERERVDATDAAERGKRRRFGGVVRAWRRVVRVVRRVV